MKTLKKWIVDLFYIPKYEKVSEKSFSRIILSSILGACICVFCLAGLTWAWFTSGVSSNVNTISAAKFDVEITVEDSGNTEVAPSSDGSYSLANDEYSVTVTATGDASTGYCKIILNEQEYHSIQLFPAGGDTNPQYVSFTVNASGDCKLKIIPQWGSYTGTASVSEGIGLTVSAENSVSNQLNLSLDEDSETSAETTPDVPAESETTYALTDTEQLYTVKEGDTLSDIAARFGTTTAVLSAYNGIQNTSYIQAGATLKIPPVGYTVPDTPDEQTTADDSTVEPPEADTSAQSSEPAEQSADTPEPVESTSEQSAATPEPVESTPQQSESASEPAESESQQSVAASEPAESTVEAADSPEAETSSASTDPEPISE